MITVHLSGSCNCFPLPYLSAVISKLRGKKRILLPWTASVWDFLGKKHADKSKGIDSAPQDAALYVLSVNYHLFNMCCTEGGQSRN